MVLYDPPNMGSVVRCQLLVIRRFRDCLCQLQLSTGLEQLGLTTEVHFIPNAFFTAGTASNSSQGKSFTFTVVSWPAFLKVLVTV